jgi:ribulose-phosphate 3-epimerase
MSGRPEVKIAASVLASDLSRLGEQVNEVEAAGADLIHVDAMDGQFVPNITFGPGILAAVRRVTRLPIGAHLMIRTADRFIGAFAEAGADVITLSFEACVHLHRLVHQIKECDKRAGVALSPATPVGVLEEILPFLDVVLVMTVNPGFGGQSFIPTMPHKIRALRRMIERHGHPIDVAVDGGIDPGTAPLAVQAGANILVAGSAIYQTGDGVAEAVQKLRKSVG